MFVNQKLLSAVNLPVLKCSEPAHCHLRPHLFAQCQPVYPETNHMSIAVSRCFCQFVGVLMPFLDF